MPQDESNMQPHSAVKPGSVQCVTGFLVFFWGGGGGANPNPPQQISNPDLVCESTS